MLFVMPDYKEVNNINYPRSLSKGKGGVISQSDKR